MVWGPRKAKPRITSPFSGAMEEMIGNKLPVLPSLQCSGVTPLSWPVCAVLSWQGRSQTLGFLVKPFRSASYAKSPQTQQNKMEIVPGPLLEDSQPGLRCQATFTISFAPTSASSTDSKCPVSAEGLEQLALVFPVLWGSPFARLSALASPGLPSPFALQISLYFTKSSKFVQATSEYPAQNMAPSLPPNYSSDVDR